MKKLFLLSACGLIAIACGSSANNAGANRASSAVAKTNVNAVNSTPYSLTENAYTTAGNSYLGSLKPYVGKTANEIKLWQNKEIGPRLKKLMGADYATMRKFWNSETPIKKFGDFLMMTGCELHNCTDNRYVIFMDTSEATINVVHIGKGPTKEWKDGDIVLPPPFADELAAMKSRK